METQQELVEEIGKYISEGSAVIFQDGAGRQLNIDNMAIDEDMPDLPILYVTLS